MSDNTQMMIPENNTEMMEMVNTQVANIMTNTQALNQIHKISKFYAASTMVPENYQGNHANCFLACELSSRMNVSPVLVMQNLYIVRGKPSWSGQACKALIDGCGRFSESEFVFVGEQGKDDWGCFLQARNNKTGKIVKGTTVTWSMVKSEGWLNKSGSKWATMPELMIKYRAAAFFARTECPEVLMGYQTAEEIEDVVKPEPEKIKISLDG